MDIERFRHLGDLAKFNYVALKLERARTLMSEIYNGCLYLMSDDMIKELEALGDDFVRFGVAAEDGSSEDIFHDLNISLKRLEELAALVSGKSAN